MGNRETNHKSCTADCLCWASILQWVCHHVWMAIHRFHCMQRPHIVYDISFKSGYSGCHRSFIILKPFKLRGFSLYNVLIDETCFVQDAFNNNVTITYPVETSRFIFLEYSLENAIAQASSDLDKHVMLVHHADCCPAAF